jgi:hypothetical protein
MNGHLLCSRSLSNPHVLLLYIPVASLPAALHLDHS